MSEWYHGPLNKNIATQTLELLAKTLLHSKIDYDYQNKDGKTWIKINNQEFNLTQLFEHAEISHIQLDEKDSDAYMESFSHYHYDSYSFSYQNSNHPDLLKAEKAAIQDYTGSQYFNTNNFLYGKLGPDHSIHKAFLHSLMLASGLNKIHTIPDTQYWVYRGEHSMTELAIQQRLSRLNELNNLDKMPSFMSFSEDEYVADSFGGKKCKIVLMTNNAKSIKHLSSFPSEDECLFMPGYLHWEKSEKDFYGAQVFYAVPVTPLLEDSRNQQEIDAEFEAFNQLESWYQQNVGNPGSITEFNRKLLENNRTLNTLVDSLERLKTFTPLHHSKNLLPYTNAAIQQPPAQAKETYAKCQNS